MSKTLKHWINYPNLLGWDGCESLHIMETKLSKQRWNDSYQGKLDYKQAAPIGRCCSAWLLTTKWAIRGRNHLKVYNAMKQSSSCVAYIFVWIQLPGISFVNQLQNSSIMFNFQRWMLIPLLYKFLTGNLFIENCPRNISIQEILTTKYKHTQNTYYEM